MLKTSTSLVFMNNLNQSVFRGTGKNAHAIIPKGNMGYNQCTVADTAAVLLLSFSTRKNTSMTSRPILSNFFEEECTKNHPQYLLGSLRPTGKGAN